MQNPYLNQKPIDREAMVLEYAPMVKHIANRLAARLPASIQLDECVDGSECRSVLPEDVNAPTFFRIDLKKKRMFNGSTEGGAVIHHTKRLGGKLLLQGVTPDAGPEDAGTGWTVSLEPETSRFVAAVTTEQAAVVIFGACTQ